MPGTREERQTAVGFLLPFQPRGVDPDVGIDQGERQTAAFTYSGIAAEDPEEPEGGHVLDDLDSLTHIRRVLR